MHFECYYQPCKLDENGIVGQSNPHMGIKGFVRLSGPGQGLISFLLLNTILAE